MSYQKAQIIRMGQTQEHGSLYHQNETQTLPKYEIQSIKMRSSLSMSIREQEQMHSKQILKQLSEDKMKNWSNTIEAIRKQKQAQKFQDFVKAEEGRRALDLQEAQYQEKVKQAIIDRVNIQIQSNKIIFEQGDRQKQLKSKMLISDCLQEREIQKVQQSMKQNMESLINQRYEEMSKNQLKQQNEKEILENQLKKNKNQQFKKDLDEQNKEFKEKFIQKYFLEMEEGQKIFDEAKAFKDEQEQQKKIIKDRNQQLNKEIQKNNSNNLLIKQKQEYQYESEYLKTLEFQNQKEKQNQFKEEQTKKFAKRKSLLQEVNFQKQSEIILRQQNLKNELIDKRIKEMDQKQQHAESLKAQKQQELKNEIQKFRNDQIEFKKQASENALQEKIELRSFLDASISKQVIKQIQEENQKLIDQQRKEHRYELKIQNLENQVFNQIQKQKQYERDQKFLQEIEESEKNQAFFYQQKQHFQSWAQQCLDEMEKGNFETKPVIIKLSKIK